MNWLIAWVLGIIVTTMIASHKGMGFKGFVLGCLLGPFAIPFALLSSGRDTSERNIIENPTESEQISKSGTGFIVSGDGYFITNNHVIDGCNKISVIYKNGSSEKLVGKNIADS